MWVSRYVCTLKPSGMQGANARRITAACISGDMASLAATMTFMGRNSPFLMPRSITPAINRCPRGTTSS